MTLPNDYTLLYQWVTSNLHANPKQFMEKICELNLTKHVKEYCPTNLLINGLPEDDSWEIQLSNKDGWEIRLTPFQKS